MDSIRAHITENIKKKIKSVNTVPVIIPGGMTKMLQPLDISVNRSFKAVLRHLLENWMSNGDHSYTTTGRLRHATFSEVANWVATAWDSVSERIIVNGFLKAEIIRNDDDTDDEDDERDDTEVNFHNLPPEIATLFHSDTEDEDFNGFEEADFDH